MNLKQAEKILDDTVKKQLEKEKNSQEAKEWIQLKDKHSRQVLETGMEIIRGEGELSSLKADLLEKAKCALLLHDVGRFYQFESGVFNKDLWHGNFGVNVLLEKDNILYDPYLLLPIKYHDRIDFSEMYFEQNYQKLSDEEKENVLLIAKLVKDADKIAIYRMFFEEGVISFSQRDLFITPKILSAFYEKKLANNKFKVTRFDFAICFLCWQFDLFFDVSRMVIKKEKINERLIKKMRDLIDEISDELKEQGRDVKTIQTQAAVLNQTIDEMEVFLGL